MKRLILLVVVALLAFYVGWPAWTGYRIKTALETSDAALLASKVDFVSVRAGLQPIVAREVDQAFVQAGRDAGALGGILTGPLKQQVVPQITRGVLETVLTPANVIRIVREGGTVREAVARVMRDELAKVGAGQGGGGALRLPNGLPGGLPGGLPKGLPGGLPGRADPPPAAAPTPAPAPGAKRTFGLGNIKRFGFAGPLAFQVGIARDDKATAPDVTVTMGFTGGDWKVVAVEPRL